MIRNRQDFDSLSYTPVISGVNVTVHSEPSGVPATANDYFRFTSHAAHTDVALARTQLDQIRVVPNPYFTGSRYETSTNPRVVKFTHLPERCSVRIFNLAGRLVRTLEKNDASSQLVWDLANAQGQTVAGGVYVFHVDAPEIGSTTGRLAVFPAK